MDPMIRAQLRAMIATKDERIVGLLIEKRALWGKLLEYISDTDIQAICTKSIKELSCH
jgi:hypothetical protein